MLGRRSDGYHEIESVFQAIDLRDELTIHARPAEHAITVAVKVPGGGAADVPADHRNLCHQAAQALIARTGARFGAHIEITKHLPTRSGLGGGSSDAAGALVGLNRLHDLGLDRDSLGEVAAAVGSDVPFFLAGATALVQGRGERVTPLSAPPLHLAVVLPDLPYLSTGDAYQRLQAPALPAPPADLAAETGRMIAALEGGDLDAVAAALHNDFERVILPAYPRIAEVRDHLLAAGCRGALLAGSGAAVFGLAAAREQAESIAAAARARGDWSVAASGDAHVILNGATRAT